MAAGSLATSVRPDETPGPVARALTALAERRLKQIMPVEGHPSSKDRPQYTHLEGLGRLLAGLAPWLDRLPGRLLVFKLGGTAKAADFPAPVQAPINLTGYNLYVINCGLNPPAPAATISIAGAGMINPGQYLVVGPDAVVAAPGALKVKSATALENGAPDGLVLAETVGKTVRDVLSYEGSCATATIPVIGMVPMVEGTPAFLADTGVGEQSLIRNPNGYDGNNLATDWVLTTKLTPGAANLP